MTNYLIMEDNILQRQNLIKIIKQINPECKIYETDNKEDALHIVRATQIEVIFIDIQLKDSNGIEFAKELREMPEHQLTWIIFITTHPDYMMDAFKQIHCYDYLVKPFNKDDIKKIIKTLNGNNIEKSEENEYVVFEKKDIIIKINVEDIIFIEVNFRTCTIHAKTGIYSVNRVSLKNVLQKINKSNILKTHRSYAVNAFEVDTINKLYRGCWQISFKNYSQVALMTEQYKDILIEKMGLK